MLALATDENFNNDIVRGALRRKPDLNVVRVQDAGLSGADDPTVLEWAAQGQGSRAGVASLLLTFADSIALAISLRLEGISAGRR